MSTAREIQPLLRDLLRSQRFAVLATDDHGQPFASLMAFAASEDLGRIVVLTERGTRKFANLTANQRVALLIDDRENKGSDTQNSVAVTALGQAQEVSRDAGAELIENYLARHPYLAAFAASRSCAVVLVTISSYQFVSRFQEVIEWRVAS
ncbi:pyridoxamine 5'-phosphate oxidase family protein [Accumulibacter sp.]|uniref:pyridoxamine 5'-phosphate oxidase family protein n=1 Tax=Accumulibacter sp. TaxID=2053492 RepID=UPI001D82678E|nr:pyridoxamine 5'-phosphate oxidase family protein [Accumulibacter sp.]MCB1966336.1 pyridoxamine 5'-phosphate oxidase family protein [Accumulibacter sp.]MCP5227069.1 pyridoxamine 5'-phosphate oxidase family protein [Accumulibacter sp.]